LNHADIRSLFTRENLLASDWYEERLKAQQERDAALYQKFVRYISEVRHREGNAWVDEELKLGERLEKARRRLAEIESPTYRARLRGTIGADPFKLQIKKPASKALAGVL
jgi:hypothetical protein